MDELTGTVERITFRNDENFYTVAKVINEANTNDLVTVVGRFAAINVGETLHMQGKWVMHPDYGRQFEVESYRVEVPATLKGIEKYLSSGFIKGIGPVTARKLTSHFGKQVLEIIEKEPQRLLEVEGIGEQRAKSIAQSLEDHKQIQDIMVFLQGYGVSPGYATRIFKHYGYNTVRIIEENPYRLADEVFGIGFKTADKLALASGIPKDSVKRLTAGLKYALEEIAAEGHTYIPQDQLLERAAKMLDVDPGKLAAPLTHLVQKKEVFIDERTTGAAAVYLAPYYYAEVGVSRLLSSLAQWQMVVGSAQDYQQEVEEYQQTHNIALAPEQRQAILQAMQNGVTVITGGPGTGKTTIVRALLYLLAKRRQQVVLAAPTGRAAKRLSEATGQEAKTIHRLLEYGYVEEKGMQFGRDENNPLTADVIIIDEASMVDLLLMYSLLKAIPPGAKLVLVGDADQLPSVGPGNVLRDIIESGVIPVARLKHIYRQAQESMIVVNAHRINSGKFPVTNKEGKDFFFINEEDPERILQIILSLCKSRLPKYKNWHPVNDIQVLSPMRRTLIGVDNLNQELQQALNPPMKDKGFVRYGSTTFRQGDKVMQIRNNYKKQVFNGDVGRIIAVDRENSVVQVLYSDDTERRTVDYDFTELDELVLAYAVSVHKSQGSEYPVVVMPVSTQHYLLLQRNLIYTAVTRAKELVVLVGTKKALAIAVRNNKVEERYTLLAQRLAGTTLL